MLSFRFLYPCIENGGRIVFVVVSVCLNLAYNILKVSALHISSYSAFLSKVLTFKASYY